MFLRFLSIDLMLIELNLWSRLHFKYDYGKTLLMDGCCFILFRVKIVWDIVCGVYWCFELDMVLHYQSVTLSIPVQWRFCLVRTLNIKPKQAIKGIFQLKSTFTAICFNCTQVQNSAIKQSRQWSTSVQSGWAEAPWLCSASYWSNKQYLSWGGRLRLTVFIGSRRQTWFYGRRNILFYGQGFYQGGLAVWNIIQERESTNQQNYSSTIQGEGAIKTILQ